MEMSNAGKIILTLSVLACIAQIADFGRAIIWPQAAEIIVVESPRCDVSDQVKAECLIAPEPPANRWDDCPQVAGHQSDELIVDETYQPTPAPLPTDRSCENAIARTVASFICCLFPCDCKE